MRAALGRVAMRADVPRRALSQSWSFPQSKSQSEFAAQARPTLPRVQAPDVQMPAPVQVKVAPLQVPVAAAVQVPVGLVQVRMLPVCAAVNGAAVSVDVPLHVVPRNETPLSGTTDGSGTVSPEPPKYRPPFTSMMLAATCNWLPGTCRNRSRSRTGASLARSRSTWPHSSELPLKERTRGQPRRERQASSCDSFPLAPARSDTRSARSVVVVGVANPRRVMAKPGGKPGQRK